MCFKSLNAPDIFKMLRNPKKKASRYLPQCHNGYSAPDFDQAFELLGGAFTVFILRRIQKAFIKLLNRYCIFILQILLFVVSKRNINLKE
jgi:hypothetical protein